MSREMKDSGVAAIGVIPESWDAVRIKYVFQDGIIKSGPYGSALKGITTSDGTHPIYNQANVIKDDFSLRRNFITANDYELMKHYKIYAGDVVFSMMGTVGKCSIVPNSIEDGIIDSHLFEARLNSLIDKDFFKYSSALLSTQQSKRQGNPLRSWKNTRNLLFTTQLQVRSITETRRYE